MVSGDLDTSRQLSGCNKKICAAYSLKYDENSYCKFMNMTRWRLNDFWFQLRAENWAETDGGPCGEINVNALFICILCLRILLKKPHTASQGIHPVIKCWKGNKLILVRPRNVYVCVYVCVCVCVRLCNTGFLRILQNLTISFDSYFRSSAVFLCCNRLFVNVTWVMSVTKRHSAGLFMDLT